MRFLLVVTVVIGAACQAENGDRAMRNDAAVLGEPSLHSADFAAYRAGREREIEALSHAIGWTGDELDSIGAHAAGLPLERYRRLTESVDGYLKEPGRHLDSTLALLDSLRVERMVRVVQVGK